MLDETDQPTLTDFVEKGSNVRVKNEVHLLVGDPDRQSVQRIVLAALRPEAIAEPEELFLVNAVQYRSLSGRSCLRAPPPPKASVARPPSECTSGVMALPGTLLDGPVHAVQ